jgi:hypothetical protein
MKLHGGKDPIKTGQLETGTGKLRKRAQAQEPGASLVKSGQHIGLTHTFASQKCHLDT